MKLTYRMIAAICILFATPALAYIDPGSGSTLMSAVIGLFVAVGMAIKTYWYKLKSFLTKRDRQ